MSEVQFSFDALSFLQEVLPEPEESTPTDSIIRRPTEPKPVEAKDENQTMLQDFARLQADQYDLKSMKKAPPVKSNFIQEYLDSLDVFYKDEQMNEAINSALMEATRPPIGQMSETARTAMFSGADMRGSELTMMNNAREAQDVVQPMVTPVSRGEQPEMADSPAPVDAPSIDARSNEMLDKPMSTAREDVIPNRGLMQRRVTDSDLKTYTENFAEVYLKKHEGVTPHKSLEGGKDTEAFGVKFSLGLKREDYKSDAEFAAAVALKHRDKVKDKFAEGVWSSLTEETKYAIVDLNYNVNSIGSTAKKTTAEDMLKNTLLYIGMTPKDKKLKGSLISLASRRAWNYNKAVEGLGLTAIKTIKQIPTDTGTKFEYLSSDGTVIKEFTTSRKPIQLTDNKGNYKILTETKELTI